MLNQGSWRISRPCLWTIVGRWPSMVVKDLDILYCNPLIIDDVKRICRLKFDIFNSDWIREYRDLVCPNNMGKDIGCSNYSNHKVAVLRNWKTLIKQCLPISIYCRQVWRTTIHTLNYRVGSVKVDQQYFSYFFEFFYQI